jgi:hypothetical protein
MIRSEKIENLRNIYEELNEDRKKKMEQIAVGLLDVQIIVEKEKTLLENTVDFENEDHT